MGNIRVGGYFHAGLIIASKIKTIRILDPTPGRRRFPAHFAVSLDVAPIGPTMKIDRRQSRTGSNKEKQDFLPRGEGDIS
jgi:hypothetical protein